MGAITAIAPLHLLYGGTFDPVHLGHLAVARAALAATAAARLDFVPAADPPHRAAPGASFAERVALLDAALASEAPPPLGGWGLDLRESQRSGPSYTVDTLRDWRAQHGPSRPLGFLLGADAFLGLPGWQAWTALFDLAHLVVARRPGHALEPHHDDPAAVGLCGSLRAATSGRWTDQPAALHAEPAGRVFIVDLPLQLENATAVRQTLAQGQTPQGLPAAVVARIAALGLYRDRPPA